MDHTTIYRWVQRYAPELEERCRPSLKATSDSWRVDETYGVWMYLYRAVDSQGKMLEFFLGATRDAPAAKRFLVKALGVSHTVTPRVITVDKNTAYPKALRELKEAGVLPVACELRQSKYLNNLVEQDHRFIKRLVKPGMGFFLFETAWRTLQGYEVMNMIRKRQVQCVRKALFFLPQERPAHKEWETTDGTPKARSETSRATWGWPKGSRESCMR